MTKSIGTSIKRLPGQGLREERDKLFENQVNDPLMTMFAGWIVLVIERVHVYLKTPPSL